MNYETTTTGKVYKAFKTSTGVGFKVDASKGFHNNDSGIAAMLKKTSSINYILAIQHGE